MLKENHRTKMLFAVSAVLIILVSIRRIFINVHIDEESMVSLAYRVLLGERCFSEMQEPQIFIAPFLALLEAPFILISGGTDGIFIYLKMLAVIMTLMVGAYLFYALKTELAVNESLIVALLFLLYHFRYVNIIDYTLLYCAGAVACTIVILRMQYSKHRNGLMIIAGISFCSMVVSLPVVAILAPLYCLWIYRNNKNKREILIFFVTCGICGLAECVVLFRGNDLKEIPSLIYALVASSTYGKSAIPYKRILKLFVAVLLFPVADIQQKIALKITEFVKSRPFLRWGGYCTSILMMVYGLYQLVRDTVVEVQFYAKTGYASILIAGLIMCICIEKRIWVKQVFFWGILVDVFASFMTKYDTQNVYALPAILATLIMLINMVKPYSNSWIRIGVCTYLAVWIAFEIYAKDVVLITNTSGGGSTIYNQELALVTQGPAKGSWARKVDKDKYDEIYSWIKQNVDSDVNVCYFGKNVLLYLMSPDISVAVPQLFMDYADDSVLGIYYETYPDKKPDLVILDVSPTTKRQITDLEQSLFEGYRIVYRTANYMIYEK